MTIIKDAPPSLKADASLLSESKIPQSIFEQLNKLYMELVPEVFELLFDSNQLHRQDEFVMDFELFKDDMLRKYTSKGDYDYKPRSHYEKLMGLKYSETIKKASTTHKERKLNDIDFDSYSM